MSQLAAMNALTAGNLPTSILSLTPVDNSYRAVIIPQEINTELGLGPLRNLSSKMIRNISAAKFWKQKMNVNIENYFSIAPESTKESQLKLLHFKKSKSGYIFENIEA